MPDGSLQSEPIAMRTAKARPTPSSPVSDAPGISTWLWLPIILPLALWGVEVGLLSPYVEFKTSAMTYIAHPLTANFLFVSTALFLLIAADRLTLARLGNRSFHGLAWLAGNITGYALLFQTTLLLQRLPTQGMRFWLLASAWIALVFWVGITAWLAFVPANRIAAWMGDCWELAIGAGILSLTLVLITPEIRKMWYLIYEPIGLLTLRLLKLAGYSELVFFVSEVSGNPVIGSRDGVKLQVTPYCAEVESLAVFCLLGGALLVTRWQRVHRWRFCVVLLGGLVLLYFLSAVRLFLLIDVATRLHDNNVAVSLAHSRLSHLAYLALSLAILVGTRRWWQRGEEPVAAVLQTSSG